MLAVEIDLLAYRFTATAFNIRGATEWPPHPARLYSAMVAAWADDDDPDEGERAALRWFEVLGPPIITCPDSNAYVRRNIVTHFVPVNDARALGRDINPGYQKLLDAEAALVEASAAKPRAVAERNLARVFAKVKVDSESAGRVAGSVSEAVTDAAVSVLPDMRGRQGRTFPTIRLVDQAAATVRYDWPEAEADEAAVSVLDAVLARVGRLGHSSTFVSCRVVTTGGEPAGVGRVTWRPGNEARRADDRDEAILRVPAAGSLARLVTQFESHRGREPRSLASRSAVYRAGGRPARASAPRSMLAGPWRVLVFPRERRVRLTRTLDVTRAVRGALLSGSGDVPPYLLHGHEAGPAGRPTGAGTQPHLSILPLANVGSEFGDGIVHGAALALPVDSTEADRATLAQALDRWQRRSQTEGRSGLGLWLVDWSTELTDRGYDTASAYDKERARGVLERQFWARPSRSWASVTPVALDRYPGRIGDLRWDDQAAASIARACQHVGLPAPEEVQIVWGPPMRGVPAAGPSGRRPDQRGRRYGGYRAGTSGQVRLCVHARLRFAERIAGPLVLGAGRFAGYGLFLPVTDGEVGR